MKCNSCGAIIDGQKKVILSQGTWSPVKHYNRVCQYALQRGKSCENTVRIKDDNLTWEAENKQIEKDFDNLYNYLLSES